MSAAQAERSRSRSCSYEEEYEESYSEDDEESSSSTPQKPPPPPVVGGSYRLGKKIGSGSYSDVHLAVDKKSGDKVAVKLEWTKAEKTNKLLNEAELYKQFKDLKGIPRIRCVESQGEYNIMVLDLLGSSLDDLFKKHKRFSVKTVAMLAKQIIGRLEDVHECGILYRDIKPHNFLMGVGEKGGSRVYLVDFGLAKSYREEDGSHCEIHVKKNRGITGTVRYSSPNVHEGIDASRRDDLLAFGYVMLRFLKGSLPWLRISHDDKKKRNELIRIRKAKHSDEDLCQGLPDEFVEYFTYCRALQFYDRPDYKRLQKLMDSVLSREGYVNDRKFDWTVPEQVDQEAGHHEAKKDSSSTRASTTRRSLPQEDSRVAKRRRQGSPKAPLVD